MASKPRLPRGYWEKKVQEWSTSGESAKSWCYKHQITYNTFLGWKKRLTAPMCSKRRQVPQHRKMAPVTSTQGFVELVDSTTTDPGICLECSGIKIHLSNSFDPLTLKRCLRVVRGDAC